MAKLAGSLACAILVLGAEHGQAVDMMRAAGLAAPIWNRSAAAVDVFEAPVPSPGRSEVLVKVKGSSVNHLDLLWDVLHDDLVWKSAQGLWKLQNAFPKILGMDIAGKVVAKGSGVSKFDVGDDVWAFNAAAAVYDGHSLGGLAGHGWAEYVAISESVVGLKPATIDHTEAGTMPLVALTSLNALKLAGAPFGDGATVLILGATSATGYAAVQLAKALGAAKVIATAGGNNKAKVDALGAVDTFIDYHEQNWWNSSVIPDDSVDAVYDCVNQPGTGDRAFSKLKSHGRYVNLCSYIPECGTSSASLSSQLKKPFARQHSLRCVAGSCASAENLNELKGYVEAGKLRMNVQTQVPLEDIQKAVEIEGSGHVVGKVSILVSKEESIVV
eukprot:TRINITY_DN100393_c0_g1_i1.p1 TRINITY_DN100393_c0_g1~~TRINITY_DN100393_c0_g1_i1.p1  ORF type:complete len:416 (-),score=72.34 TRINITY_DN100393_c0_g1_i1:242-1399(-)